MKKLVLTSLLCLAACSTNNLKSYSGKVTLENSVRSSEVPAWVADYKTNWEEGDKYYFKTSYTILGSQRINGCYDLAKLELKANVLSEVSEKIKSEINQASEGISDNLDPLIAKAITSETGGEIKGLKVIGQVHERYLINGNEKQECFILGSMDKLDYLNLKGAAFNRALSVSKQVTENIRNRQSQFFQPTPVMNSEASSLELENE